MKDMVLKYFFLGMAVLGIVVFISYVWTDMLAWEHPWWLMAMDIGLMSVDLFGVFIFFSFYLIFSK